MARESYQTLVHVKNDGEECEALLICGTFVAGWGRTDFVVADEFRATGTLAIWIV
jgi:hypothetical protein